MINTIAIATADRHTVSCASHCENHALTPCASPLTGRKCLHDEHENLER